VRGFDIDVRISDVERVRGLHAEAAHGLEYAVGGGLAPDARPLPHRDLNQIPKMLFAERFYRAVVLIGNHAGRDARALKRAQHLHHAGIGARLVV